MEMIQEIKSMNILYLDHYAGSLKYGMEFRPYYMAREWQKHGHKVTIIGGDYSHLRSVQPVVEHDFQYEVDEGIKYCWVKTGTYQGNGIKRALSMLRYVGKLWLHASRLVNELHPDVVISSSTYPLDSYAAFCIARKAHARYIHEAHDVWPLTLIELGGMSKHHPFVVLMDWAEKHAYRKAEKVVSVLPAVLPHMMEQGLGDDRKFVHIPNGVAIEDWENAQPLDEEHNSVLNCLHMDGKFIIGYVGGHGFSNDLDRLLDAASLMIDQQNVVFVLVGKGPEKERLQARATNNVIFLPPVSKKQVPSILKKMDALFICAEPCPLYRYGVSMNKVYDYMMSGKPILYGVEAANNDVSDAQCGITFSSDKPEEIRNAIGSLKSMSDEERRDMGKKAMNWVQAHCRYDVLAEQFIRIIER